MIGWIKRWWHGTMQVEDMSHLNHETGTVFPLVYTQRHWTSRSAHAVVGLLRNSHVQWIIGIVLAFIGIGIGWLSLK